MFKYICIILSVIILSHKENAHPLKLSATLISYNQHNGSVYIETKFFCDDFAFSINKIRQTPINLDNLSKEDLNSINTYYNNDFVLKINEKPIRFEVEKTELITDFNVIVLKFKLLKLNLKLKDKLFIKNTLMLKEFNLTQINRVTLRVPPYINEENLQELVNASELISKKTGAFIQYLNQSDNPGAKFKDRT